MHRAIRAAAVGIVAAALAFGCTNPDDGVVEPIDAPVPDEDSGDNVEVEPEPDAAEDTDPEPESHVDPEPEIDISVIPDEITVEYVDAVLVELERLYAEAARIASDQRDLTVDVADRITSIYGQERSDEAYSVFRAIAEAEAPIIISQHEASPRTYRTVSILDVASECLWVETIGDQSSLYVEAPNPRPTFILLRARDFEPFRNLNPTPWVYHAQRVGADSELREARPCEG